MVDGERPIVVLGGTGHLGRHAVRAARAQGARVRVLSRSAAAARALLGDGPEIVEGDLADPAAARRVLDGAAGVVVAVSAFARRTFRRLREIEHDAVIAALEEAARLGVRRVVYLSVFDIDAELVDRIGLASADVKAGVERWLRGSELDWTVLGQPPSMEIFFAMIRGGRVMAVPGGGPPALPSISPRDTGELAAQAVLRADLGGRRLRLAGPEALSFPAAAERIGAVWGRRIRFVRIPLAGPLLARRALAPLAGLSEPAGYAHALLGFVRLLNEFPPELAARAADDHRLLRELFAFTPTTIEDEARLRLPAKG